VTGCHASKLDYVVSTWDTETSNYHTQTSRRPIKNYHSIGKKTDILHLVFLGENILFKESPPSIMVTRNSNWSTEILWYGTGYAKEKMLSPPKHPS
jgi:hypothetical protein